MGGGGAIQRPRATVQRIKGLRKSQQKLTGCQMWVKKKQGTVNHRGIKKRRLTIVEEHPGMPKGVVWKSLRVFTRKRGRSTSSRDDTGICCACDRVCHRATPKFGEVVNRRTQGEKFCFMNEPYKVNPGQTNSRAGGREGNVTRQSAGES